MVMDNNTVDQCVGREIRNRRILLGVSQSELADRCGVTFQQVQKYENGKNRVAASRLYQIAHALGCDVGHFFSGMAEADGPSELGASERLCLEASRAFVAIPSRDLQQAMVDLMRTAGK